MQYGAKSQTSSLRCRLMEVSPPHRVSVILRPAFLGCAFCLAIQLGIRAHSFLQADFTGQSGVVVELCATGSESEKAGLKKGDRLLMWSRGGAEGELRSPFELAEIEREQRPRGPVTIRGS